MKNHALRMTTALLAALVALVLLSGCSAITGDKTGTVENLQLTKDRQAKIQSHRVDP